MSNQINILDNSEKSDLQDQKLPSLRIEVGNRLKEVVSMFNNLEEAAKIADVSEISLRRYISGSIQAPFEPLVKLAIAKHVSLNWLFTGKKENPEKTTVIQAFEQAKEVMEEVSMIVAYPSINVSAGFGSFNEGITKPDGQEPYADSLLQKLGVKADNCGVFWANGTSMEPTICDGDQMLVDFSKKEARGDDKIYLIQNGESVWVKRVRREWDYIELISDNESYRPIRITEEDAQNLQIIGQVVHTGHALV